MKNSVWIIHCSLFTVKVKSSNEQYVASDIKQPAAKSRRVKRHILPDTAYVVPGHRMTTEKIPKHEQVDATLETKVTPPAVWRKFFRPMKDDEKVNDALHPCN